MNEQTLELQIKSKAQEAKSSVDSLVKSLTNVENVLTNIYSKMGSIEKNGLKTTVTNVNQLKQATDKATTSANKLGKALSLGGTYLGAKRLTMQMIGWMNEAVDFTEQLNLFNVVFDNVKKNGVQTFSELGKSATQFQYKLNEAFGTNKTQSLYMQGIFQSMGETVGIKDTYSAIMSETMTKLTYDLASLYNKSEKTTAEAIRAGVYAGQTKPLRSYGIDVTQQSLQPILDSLGIDKQVKNMSQAEKEILRYLATLKQAKNAMGDLANTVESPSNQLKIFKQQLVETKVAISSLFMGLYSNVLPYANAFLMVIKEVSKAIADMFGIELTDYNSGIASQEGIYDGIEESADNASNAVKELKRQTLGFDEIHNINENTDSVNGTSVSGGIDQRLLDAITGYDNGMDKVRMKATEIRDRIMEWLGFTKEINPLTGEISFKYGGIKKTIKNIWDSFKGLNTQSKIFVGIGLYALVSKLFSGTKKLTTVLGTGTGLLGITQKLVSPMKSLYTSLDNVNYYNKSLTQGLAEGISNWSNSLTMADRFKVSLVGILGLSTSMAGMASTMKSVSNEGWNLANSLGAVTSELGLIGSGAYIGSAFGPMGTAIGGVTGALIGLYEIYMKMPTEVTRTNESLKQSHEELSNYLITLEQQNKAIEDSLTKDLTITGYHKNLINELENLIDANGQVKKGYEDRAQFIVTTLNQAYGLEIEIINGKILNYDKEIDKIKEVIKKKEAEILLEANQEKYAKALEEENKLWYNKETAIQSAKKAQENYNKAQAEYDKAYQQWVIATGKGIAVDVKASAELKKRRDALNKATEALNTAKNDEKDYVDQYIKNQSTIIDYSNLSQAVITGNYDEIQESIKNYVNTFETESGKEQLTLSQRLSKTSESLDLMLDKYKDTGEQTLNAIRSSYESILKETYNELINITTTTEELSDDVIDAWATLAKNSEEKFTENFSILPDQIKQKVVDKMYDKGYEISEELQKGLKEIYPEINIKTNVNNTTVKIDADTSMAEKKTNNWLNNLFSKLSSLGNFSINAGIGGGGSGGSRFNADGGIYSNGTWKNIQQYANGGAPSHGTLFWAGENGAEIVAHANGKTEVLNQSQIASAIYSAVYSAMSQFGGQTNEIDVHVHTDEGTVVDRINQKTKQTGVCPINIPIK